MRPGAAVIKTQTGIGSSQDAPKAWLGAVRRVSFLLLMVVTAISGCLGSADPSPTQRSIALDTKPCQQPELWPFSLGDQKNRFLVHYRSPDEIDMARTVVSELEAAWDFETQTLGFEPPLPDAGECGPDERFDVFIWRGKETCFVQIIHEGLDEKYILAPGAPWGGRTSYMVVDPWGKYGKEILGQTMAHELNHASHAVQDWYEAGDVFEMTATYVEQYFNKALAYNIVDFQAHPDWGLLFYDDYATYYMYGSGLYLYFLRDYYFSRQASVDEKFPARLWSYVRNDELRPLVNKPNLVDGLTRLLAPFGHSFADSALVFARWRYYAGSHDDGKHFKPWPGLAKESLLPFLQGADIKPVLIVLANTSYKVEPPPMLLGNGYVEITGADASQKSFRVTLDAPLNAAVRWVVQAVPGTTEGSDGETLDLSPGWARVDFAGAANGQRGKRTLIITAVPTTTLDPDDRSAERFPATLRVQP